MRRVWPSRHLGQGEGSGSESVTRSSWQAVAEGGRSLRGPMQQLPAGDEFLLAETIGP